MISWNTVFGDQAGEDESRTSMILLENYTSCCCSQPTHSTELSEILEKEMVSKRGNDSSMLTSLGTCS